MREAIRPNVFGLFEDLLLAVTKHPAMLLYLDNWRSIGPNSAAGGGRRGLNENFAREVMELHTLGVGGGYTQDDVTALARLLTGWTIEPGRASLSQSLQTAFQQSKGRLSVVFKLVQAPEPWQQLWATVRDPQDLVFSGLRATALDNPPRA